MNVLERTAATFLALAGFGCATGSETEPTTATGGADDGGMMTSPSSQSGGGGDITVGGGGPSSVLQFLWLAYSNTEPTNEWVASGASSEFWCDFVEEVDLVLGTGELADWESMGATWGIDR